MSTVDDRPSCFLPWVSVLLAIFRRPFGFAIYGMLGKILASHLGGMNRDVQYRASAKPLV